MSHLSTVLTSAVQRGARRIGVTLPRGLLRFIGVGLAGLATHTGVFTLLFRFGVDKSVAWFCGLAAATALTWALNRRFTFAASGRRRRVEFLRYMSVTAVAQSISFAVFRTALIVAPFIAPPIDVMIGAVVATLFSYTGQRFFTFAPQKTTSPTPQAAPADPRE